MYIYIYIYIFTTEGFFEVAIESWPEWDLNPQPLNSVQMLSQLSYQAMNSTHTQSQLCTATPILSFVQCHMFLSQFPKKLSGKLNHPCTTRKQ